MNKSHDERELIDFLKSYPDSLPSSQEKARMVRRISRELKKIDNRAFSPLDYLFTIGLPITFLLVLAYSFWPETGGQLVLWGSAQTVFIDRVFEYTWLAGIILIPVLLTIMPLARGGKN